MIAGHMTQIVIMKIEDGSIPPTKTPAYSGAFLFCLGRIYLKPHGIENGKGAGKA